MPPWGGYFVGDCGNIYGSMCRVRCNDGFDMDGSQNITCEAKPGNLIGAWDNRLPSCKGSYYINKKSTSLFLTSAYVKNLVVL